MGQIFEGFQNGLVLKALRLNIQKSVLLLSIVYCSDPAWTIKKGKCECPGLNILNKTANILIDGIQPVRYSS